MAESYDNSRYTYEGILAGNGHYYTEDSLLRYSKGVEQMQERLNAVDCSCGTPDGKYGPKTTTAVLKFQREHDLRADNKAGKDTLTALDAAFFGGSSGGGDSTTLYCSNSYLTLAQMKVNAQYILDYLRNKGWTKNAVCGMLGNMQTESTINPGIWQSLKENNTSGGFGLVQWTPATKYIDWAKSQNLEVANMDSELQRILYELEHGEQYYATSAYNLSFSAFSKSTQSAYYLACAFLHNYERPKDSSQDETRGSQATYWYNNLT